MELKTYTQVGPKFLVEKINSTFYIMLNMISSANAQGK